MREKFKRNVFIYKHYFFEFYDNQSEEVKKKTEWILNLIRDIPIVPEKFFKHLEGSDGLFEIRVKVGSNIFRIFSFFDKNNLVIIMNGFQKKTEKTPANEIDRAHRIKKEYEDENKKLKKS
jgi:phage-related protein